MHYEASLGRAPVSGFLFSQDGPAKAAAFLTRCPDGDCSMDGRTVFGWPLIDPPLFESDVEGTLVEFEPGHFRGEVTLRDTSAGTSETGPVRVVADISWVPQVDVDAGS